MENKERIGPLFTLGNRIYLKASFQHGRAPNIIIVTGPHNVPGWDSNPEPLSLDKSALLTELMKSLYIQLCVHIFFKVNRLRLNLPTGGHSHAVCIGNLGGGSFFSRKYSRRPHRDPQTLIVSI